MQNDQTRLCPSSTFEGEGNMVFGIVGGSARQRRVIYLKQMLPANQIDRARLEDIAPEEVFRTAGPCAKSQCAHHDNAAARCTLAERVVAAAAEVVDRLAYCAIRPRCMWWSQHGRDACARCPQVVSIDRQPDEAIAQARMPPGSASAGC
ncbi:hypothetical protein VL04_08780 [Chromobacterium violaceum]|uniref:hypothetical protein n=1 Tax=Chromobacterium violaceum TaxID=536 RepID=UPI000653A97C|nr:hypothetical protein [Chromobacterium violaceum]KMN48591.1 hypothetical protein VK93_15045 [Chromobacterium violaceum]KMN87441.1 hypothetical protein VL02_04150 [Chromobacterium violaceum]KMN90916.1 hypothetical protein VL04_08780 [Chromobacterium violaceum]KMO03041.1 hypothetical protein VL16_14035 [Chromobacterium violaceum]